MGTQRTFIARGVRFAAPAPSIYQRQAVLVPGQGRQVGKSPAAFRLSLMLLHARSIFVGFSLSVLARTAPVYAYSVRWPVILLLCSLGFHRCHECPVQGFMAHMLKTIRVNLSVRSASCMMMVYLAPVTTFVVRLFSVHYSRKWTCFLFGMWLAMFPFLFEKINRTRFVFSGEKVPPKECVLLFANHRTEVDWMYLWDLALRKGRLQSIKYILKKSLMKLPIFNWAFHIIEFIPVERNWEVDEPLIRRRLSQLKYPKDPLWLAVFPEGTDYTEKKCIKSQEYAAEHGLPILKNVLLPKIKGFNCCLQELRSNLDAGNHLSLPFITLLWSLSPQFFVVAFYEANGQRHGSKRRTGLNVAASAKWFKEKERVGGGVFLLTVPLTYSFLINAVYDITIAYKHRLPTFMDNVYGIDPSEVHVHTKIIQVCDIPTAEDEVSSWLTERFRLKDELLSDFLAQGHFPNEGTEEDLSTLKCVANFVAVIGMTAFFIYLTLFSSVWFRVFAACSASFLTFATVYSIHAPQIVCLPEAGAHAKKA
ncbi:putative 1-acyl-sn-glycerol-3-phosphate acyltransferase 5 [Triticum urartu]|uniref:1-acylglycerol-3-phosphate O-acyltransferase n=1 Tax=Triticum urartu TaxID=4572 RepID=M7ZG45_TRIUA|nr:putative 1-acyl-sn-glycerol-3-phosphate acyltransferase 5 [Triticum urartu]